MLDRAEPRRVLPSRLLVPIFLVIAAFALYGAFLSNPLVFDDHWFFEHSAEERLSAVFNPRWLPYASIDLTRILLGEDMVWLRLENLALHSANSYLLFLFLRSLFETVLSRSPGVETSAHYRLSPGHIAFAAALLFLVHPVAVYGVAYLVQRSTLMATMFALMSWTFFLKGITTERHGWLLGSAAAYLLSVFSKEHAIMAPAVSLALFFLVRENRKSSLRLIAPTFVIYAMAAALIMLHMSGVLATAYEPNAAAMSSERNPNELFLLSVVTQCFLYFKYLALWLVPITSSMSVDMREPLANGLWVWPQTAGAVGFILLPIIAGYLISRKGRAGLAGFGLLCSWLLFATELATVRAQEIFVLYRSYLWMPCIATGFPLLFHKLAARQATALLVIVTIIFTMLSWNRLTTFSDPLLLWDDALQLALKRPNSSGLGRIYHNRGVAYLDRDRNQEAIQDFDEAIRYLPAHSAIYNDRAVAYLQMGKYSEALNDFERAIRLDPGYYNPYLGRAKVHEAMGNLDAAQADYEHSCRLGVTEVCDKF